MILKEGLLEEDEARYLASYNHSASPARDGSGSWVKPQAGFSRRAGGMLSMLAQGLWPGCWRGFLIVLGMEDTEDEHPPIRDALLEPSGTSEVVTFVLSLAAFLLPRWLAALCVVVIVGILCRLKGSLGVLLLSVLVGKIHKNHHERAVIYYSWTLGPLGSFRIPVDDLDYGSFLRFPCWKLLLCLLGAVSGGLVGHHLWEHYWQQYSEVSLLKAYRGIDPSVVPGTQIQDAGAVDFVSSAGIDSEHAGCFMNAGRTYCIAPIVTNGTMLHNIGGAPRYGSYDYFAVGVDCCSCPDINFRCGAWRHPWAEGGIRSTDLEARPFYRLAVEAWASSYRKTAAHPLFFEWVESPVAHWTLGFGRVLWVLNDNEVFTAFVSIGYPYDNFKVLLMPSFAIAKIGRILQRHDALCLALRATPSKTLRQNFWKGLAFSVLLFSGAIFAFSLTLARLQQALVVHGWASPWCTPAPPQGFETAWERWLPEMMESYKVGRLWQVTPGVKNKGEGDLPGRPTTHQVSNDPSSVRHSHHVRHSHVSWG
ncbi:unnamed protein product [Durusdinium trenchii]|uniref:Uncharacterized protein n=1 Tax=Durusdinium trenchii TaxID=1381693 RepID=A0ABP0P189_9DINO